MSDLNIRDAVFRAAIDAASLSLNAGISCAADMVQEAAGNERFLAALRAEPAAALSRLADAIRATNDQGQEVQGD